MDLISDLLPEVPSLLDPTNPLHNVTLLTNIFSIFLGTYLGSLAGQTVRHVLGESDIFCHLIQHSLIQIIASNKD